MEIKVTKAVVVTGRGTDKVLLDTDYEAGTVSERESGQKLSLRFETTPGEAVSYLTNILSIDKDKIEIVELPKSDYKFSTKLK